MLNQHLNDKIEHYHQYSGQIVQLMMFNIQSLSLILTLKKTILEGPDTVDSYHSVLAIGVPCCIDLHIDEENCRTLGT